MKIKIKQSLVDIIVAIYYNSLSAQGEDFLPFLKKIAIELDVPDELPGMEGIDSANAAYDLKQRILEIIDQKKGVVDRTYLLTRVRLDVGTDDHVYQSFKIAVESFDDNNTDHVDFGIAFLNLRNSLYELKKQLEFKSVIAKAYRRVMNGDYKDLGGEVRELIDKLEPVSMVAKEGKDPALMDEVNYDNIEDIRRCFDEITSTSQVGQPFKMGFAGMMAMLGEAEGLRRSDTVTIAADSHNFKSGLLMHVARMAAQYNVAVPVNGKIPTIVFISLENEARQNNLDFYRMFRAQEGVFDQKKDIDPETASEYVRKKFKENGWTFIMLRYDPTAVNMTTIINKLETLSVKGHDIRALFLDYLAMIEDRSDLRYNNITGADQRALFRKARAYCSPRNILFVTPHQLSPKVKDYIEEGNSSELLVKRIKDLALYDGGKAIRQELDVEFIIHLEKRQIGDETKTYITVALAKHRGVQNTKESHKFFAMEFNGDLGLLDDINAPNFVRKLPGNFSGFVNADDF